MTREREAIIYSIWFARSRGQTTRVFFSRRESPEGRELPVPIYEYQCETCHHTFEVIQKFSDEPIKTCAICSGPVRRLLSPPALVFKGTGWYVTDYASPERKKALEGEKKGPEVSSDTGPAEHKAQAEKDPSTE